MAIDLRALTREEGEAEEREEGEAEGRREEQSSASGEHQEEREAEQGIRRGAKGSKAATHAVMPSCGGGIAVGSGGARRGRSTWSA